MVVPVTGVFIHVITFLVILTRDRRDSQEQGKFG